MPAAAFDDERIELIILVPDRARERVAPAIQESRSLILRSGQRHVERPSRQMETHAHHPQLARIELQEHRARRRDPCWCIRRDLRRRCGLGRKAHDRIGHRLKRGGKRRYRRGRGHVDRRRRRLRRRRRYRCDGRNGSVASGCDDGRRAVTRGPEAAVDGGIGRRGGGRGGLVLTRSRGVTDRSHCNNSIGAARSRTAQPDIDVRYPILLGRRHDRTDRSNFPIGDRQGQWQNDTCQRIFGRRIKRNHRDASRDGFVCDRIRRDTRFDRRLWLVRRGGKILFGRKVFSARRR